MKTPLFRSTLFSLFTLTATSADAGDLILENLKPVKSSAANAFANARRPVTNPTLFDSPLPTTKLHGIFLNHQFPDQLNLSNGTQADFGGDLQLYALQFEYAFTERFSLVALKDGYADFNPDDTFSSETGFANIGAGLKYAYIYDPAKNFVASATLAFEIPLGDDEVFQGEGDGNVILTTQALKLNGPWQYLGALGVSIPLDDGFSTNAFASGHISYEVSRWFIPFFEANVFTVLDEGDGGERFSPQVGGQVAALAPSEGADILNFGSAESETYVTAAIGFQTRLTEQATFGIAYEIPLTDEEDNITESRITIDLSYTF